MEKKRRLNTFSNLSSFWAQKIVIFFVQYPLVFNLLISFNLFCVFCVAKIFLQKSVFASMCTPFNSPMENYFLPFFFICMDLFLIVWIFYDHLWESFLFCENLIVSMFICENLFFFVRIFLNPSYLWESLPIYDGLWESSKTSFWFL